MDEGSTDSLETDEKKRQNLGDFLQYENCYVPTVLPSGHFWGIGGKFRSVGEVDVQTAVNYVDRQNQLGDSSGLQTTGATPVEF